MPVPFLIVLAALASVPLAAILLARRPGLAPAFAAVPLALFAAVLLMPRGVSEIAWIPTLGVSLAWNADGLSALFAMLITGIGTLIFLYASAYMKGDPMLHRFLAVLALFMAAMLGSVLADDLVLLFLFWEMTSLASFLLIGYKNEEEKARKSAVQGLLVTVGGGLALLAGILLLGAVAGSFRISEIIERKDIVLADPLAGPILILVAVGAFSKSAQWPLHMWLPNAMAAPTPVSAYLHSATMVKLGVYLLARLNPVFAGMSLWQDLLTAAGGLTMLTGALLALRETDLKRVLAWSTVASLGTLVMLIGLPDPMGAKAMVVFLLGHALYKAALFLVAGIIDHETGTREATELGGLAPSMPLTAAAAALAALSMAGLPPMFGFIGKEVLYEATLTLPGLLVLVAIATSTAMVVVAAIVAARPFLGARRPTPAEPHDPPAAMLAGPALLAALGVLFGVMPGLVSGGLVSPAVSAVLGTPAEVSLHLWHGFSLVLMLSLLTVAAGLGLFLGWPRVQPQLSGMRALDTAGPDAAYARAMAGLARIAGWQTQAIQSGSLRRYVAITLGLAFGGAGLVLVASGGGAFPAGVTRPGLEHLGLMLLAGFGAVAAARLPSVIGAVMAAAVLGFSVGLLFLALGATDLAFTQFTVEVVSLLLLVAVLARVPFRAAVRRSARERRVDGLIAGAVGLSGFLLLLAVSAVPFDTTLPDWMGAASYPEAKGRNVVNVILVDFRALDTLGEITVLGIAALSAWVLFRRIRGERA
ncbi:MAG: proton-conducting transporter membrane subunit [Acetobacteraceae bacterium]|nr:proton-conducting transporter membrane subunit [Acetobacteraceae bacterium]